ARVAAGSFREDLYYRIHTVPIAIPPLRERGGDVPLLAEHFLVRFGERHHRPGKSLSPAVVARLEAHPWHGNVRELQHVIEMLVLFSDGEVIDEADLPRALRRPTRSVPTSSSAGSATAKGFAASVEEFERALLTEAIAAAGGVKAEAARRLGLDANQIRNLR